MLVFWGDQQNSFSSGALATLPLPPSLRPFFTACTTYGAHLLLKLSL